MRPSRKGATLTKGIAIRRPVGATPKNGPRMAPRNTPHATRTSVPKASPSCIISASGKAWKSAVYCATICACPWKRTPRATFSMKPSGWQVAAAAPASRRFSAATCASCTCFIAAGVMMPPAHSSSRQPEDAGGLRTGRDAPSGRSDQRGRLAHQLFVGRAARPRMVLEADPQVAAALERQTREPRGDHVPAQHRDRPGEVASLEHGEVGLQAGRAGREAEGHAGPAEIALVSAEVELHEGDRRQPPRALARERDAQEARLEASQHGAQAAEPAASGAGPASSVSAGAVAGYATRSRAQAR